MSKLDYYAARAIDERLQARAATDLRAAAAHLEMSARYEALSSGPSPELPRTQPLAMIGDLTDALPGSQPSLVWNPTD